MPVEKMTVGAIKAVNRAHGCHFFDRDTMHFFRSKVHGAGYVHGDRVLFVTSEQFVNERSDFREPRKYTVRIMSLETGDVDKIGTFQGHATLEDARAALHEYRGNAA